MSEVDRNKLKDIFADAIALPSADRVRFVHEASGGDHKLANEVISLIDASDATHNLIEGNRLDLSSTLAGGESDRTDVRFGNYRIVRELGHGGMGTVFLAKRDDGEFEQTVALKLVRTSIADSTIIERFRRERQILAGLNHPNIAALHDGGVTEIGEPFIAMEFVDGTQLNEYSETHNLSVDDRLRLFLKVCSAVAYAHRNLIVHRDIKPSNILIGSDGEPKLLDFGLAKAFESDSAMTQTAVRAFTPAYASPEQILGRRVTTSSDVYSLGVVLYELLSGEKPFHFDGKSLEEIINTITTVEPPPPSAATHEIAIRSNLNTDLDIIALKALQREPEQRYATVEDMNNDLERYLNGMPILARPATFTYRASKLIQRNKIAVAASVFVIAALIAGMTIAFWQANVARTERDRARAESEKAERINTFLQQMLSFSNQSFTSVSPIAQSKNVTVNEMLDQITPRVEIELADQPEVRARVLRTIGNAYASQGNYDKADRNLRAALEVQRQLYGEKNIETADTMIQLGVLDYRRAMFDESRELLTKAVNFYRTHRVDAPDNSAAKLIQALDFLSVNYFYTGDTATARQLCEEGLNIADSSRLAGAEREVIAGLKVDYGVILARLGENTRGEQLVREGIDIYTSISDRPRWEMANAKAALANSLINRSEPDEALTLLQESEKIIRETLGDENLYMASTLKMRAIANLDRGDLKPAELDARRTVEILAKLFPGDNAFSAGALVTLGTILTKTGRTAEADDILRRAVAVYESATKRNPALLIPARLALATNLSSQGKQIEAETLVKDTLSFARTELGESNPMTQQLVNWNSSAGAKR